MLILLLAPGFSWQGTQHDLSVQLLQITFPYLLFISLVAFAGSILNAHGQFAIPAFTPVFLNICMIGAAIWLAPLMDEPVRHWRGVFLLRVSCSYCFKFLLNAFGFAASVTRWTLKTQALIGLLD